jgi:hypothetical protein
MAWRTFVRAVVILACTVATLVDVKLAFTEESS